MDDELYDQYPLADQEEIERSRRAFKTWKALQLGAKRWAGFVRRTILFSGVCHEREVIAVYADRFLLTRELGEGGMAVVYEAVEDGDGLNKAFALKIIKPEFHAYFESELDSLRRLQARGFRACRQDRGRVS